MGPGCGSNLIKPHCIKKAGMIAYLYGEFCPSFLSSVLAPTYQGPGKCLPSIKTASDASQTHTTYRPSSTKPSRNRHKSRFQNTFILSRPRNSSVSNARKQKKSLATMPRLKPRVETPSQTSYALP